MGDHSSSGDSSDLIETQKEGEGEAADTPGKTKERESPVLPPSSSPRRLGQDGEKPGEEQREGEPARPADGCASVASPTSSSSAVEGGERTPCGVPTADRSSSSPGEQLVSSSSLSGEERATPQESHRADGEEKKEKKRGEEEEGEARTRSTAGTSMPPPLLQSSPDGSAGSAEQKLSPGRKREEDEDGQKEEAFQDKAKTLKEEQKTRDSPAGSSSSTGRGGGSRESASSRHHSNKNKKNADHPHSSSGVPTAAAGPSVVWEKDVEDAVISACLRALNYGTRKDLERRTR